MLAYTGDTASIKYYTLPSEVDRKDVSMKELMGVMMEMERSRKGSEWHEKKSELGLAFPTLPYYIDGEVKLTQTFAICVYLEQKHGLIPKDMSAKGLGEAVMVLGVGRDWFERFNRMIIPTDKVRCE